MQKMTGVLILAGASVCKIVSEKRLTFKRLKINKEGQHPLLQQKNRLNNVAANNKLSPANNKTTHVLKRRLVVRKGILPVGNKRCRKASV